MTGKSGKSILPNSLTSVCFNKDNFMKENFSVDVFVNECRKRVSLETIRDDLSTYLKVLRTAMIELINKDYADFVHFSANLVGLDKAIHNLSVPLGQLKEEVLSVKTVMDEGIEALQVKLNRKIEIKEQKAAFQNLMNIIHSVKKMEKLLNVQLKNEDHFELSGPMIERVATEFNHLHFYLLKNQALPLVDKIKLRAFDITTTLEQNLERSLREGLERENIEILKQCLRTYATIDKIKNAENLFRVHTVQPYMDKIISEDFVRKHNLKKMYDSILDFIPKHCKSLQMVTSGSLQSVEVIQGYDFLVNAVWTEITSTIESRIPFIFSPGNPDIFHKKYGITMDFIDNFERQCGSQASVNRLREHPSYNNFLSRWNLVVYYQIRFQEIAATFEKALCMPFNTPSAKTIFRFHCTHTLWLCMNTCWSDSVYITFLCHKFWKLTLQLISRFASWISEFQQKELNVKKEGFSEPTGMDNNKEKELIENKPDHDLLLSQSVTLVADSESFLLELSNFFLSKVKPKLIVTGFTDFTLLEESLSESGNLIAVCLPNFSSYIVDELTSHCSVHLKLISDIPRLYRRTNREVPSKASSYVSNLLKPIVVFLDRHEHLISPERKMQWCQSILQNISEQYLTITSDVLTSVKKMEDSLKRLKKARDKPSLSALVSSPGVSDDDKIRLQLALDIEQFGTEIDSLGIAKEEIKGYQSLMKMMDAATTNSVLSDT